MFSPVLLMIFKRPDTTKRVFERIREAQPPRLYIAADGPRKERIDEIEKCQAARAVVENVDWPCEVHRLYREDNLGCGKGVSSAVTWFFEHEEQGIIIEDDVLPHIDFFRYCDEMLDRFKDDTTVQLISGNNYFYDGYESEFSYYKSLMMNIWGWASWRRVWKTYKYDVNEYSQKYIRHRLFERFPKSTALYYIDVYKKVCRFSIDTWDYQFFFNQVFYDRYSISPYNNMVKNIGFDSTEATHTNSPNLKITMQQVCSPFPLRHPEPTFKDYSADLFAIESTAIKLPTITRRILNRVNSINRFVRRLLSQLAV